MNEDTLLKDAETYARTRLSEKRHAHTLRVAAAAERLARLHRLDPKKARLAALLHDAARETAGEELLRVAHAEDLTVGEFETERPMLLHGPVAAEQARKDLGVEDEGVLAAVRAHTTGEPGMGPLALALYVADKIEPGREGAWAEELRELANKDLEVAAAAALEGSVSHNERRGRPVHPKSRQALEWLKGEEPAEAATRREV